MVAVQLPNLLEGVLAFLACARMGAIFSPVAMAYRGHELRQILPSVEPKLYLTLVAFHGGDHAALLLDLKAQGVTDTAVVVLGETAPDGAQALGPLLRQHGDGTLDPRWFPAVVLYALLVLGLALFALPRARSGSMLEAAAWCAALGVICYSVYDLTNYSTMQGFPLKVVVVDMIWGGVICATAGAAMHLSART